MTHLEYLSKRLETKQLYRIDYIVLNTLIHSLSSFETCLLFDMSFNQDYHIRHYVLSKISNDITKNFTADHRKLILSLLEKLDEKGLSKKDTCSFSLDQLYDSLPTRYKNLILQKFLNSRSVRTHDRAFKRLNIKWNKKYQNLIEHVWNSYKDTNCLRIIINHFSANFLEKNYKDLLKITKPVQASKLLLKLGAINFEFVKELKDIDQISYSYVLAKLGKRLSDAQASEFLKNNYRDERIGLLLWSFGKMGLWDKIVEFDVKI